MDTPQQTRDRRIREQQAAIRRYWNTRVQVRRAQWDRNMREAFDRNMNVIDQAVNESIRLYSSRIRRMICRAKCL